MEKDLHYNAWYQRNNYVRQAVCQPLVCISHSGKCLGFISEWVNVKQEVVINRTRNILFTNLNQNEAQSVHPESTHKGVN